MVAELAVLEPLNMRARILIGCAICVMAASFTMGCGGSKQAEEKAQAAKYDRSKIDDEVSKGATTGDAAPHASTGK